MMNRDTYRGNVQDKAIIMADPVIIPSGDSSISSSTLPSLFTEAQLVNQALRSDSDDSRSPTLKVDVSIQEECTRDALMTLACHPSASAMLSFSPAVSARTLISQHGTQHAYAKVNSSEIENNSNSFALLHFGTRLLQKTLVLGDGERSSSSKRAEADAGSGYGGEDSDTDIADTQSVVSEYSSRSTPGQGQSKKSKSKCSYCKSHKKKEDIPFYYYYYFFFFMYLNI